MLKISLQPRFEELASGVTIRDLDLYGF